MITRMSDHKPRRELEPMERVRQKICQAIVTIHAECRYYDGLDMLCEIAGWPTFRNELYPPAEMDAWIKQKGAGCWKAEGGGRKVEDKKQEIEPKPAVRKSKICSACGRRHEPGRVYLRKSKSVCAECGRRINRRSAR